MSYLKVNDILANVTGNNAERVLWVSSDYSLAYTIDLVKDRMTLAIRNISEMDSKIDIGEIYIDNSYYL